MTYKEIFKLAQDKGYRLMMARDISDTGLINTSDYLWGDEPELEGHYNSVNILETTFIELCLIQKWLREKCQTHVSVYPSTHKLETWEYGVQAADPMYYTRTVNEHYPSYEMALLNGVNEGLRRIKI